MVQNLNNNLIEFFKNFLEKNVIVIQDGFLPCRYSIAKFNFFIEDEILNIESKENKNYLKINLNQIYNLEFNENEIKFYLDNDTTICLMI